MARYNQVRYIFAAFGCRTHLLVKVEVGYGLSTGHVNSCPADVLVLGWDRGKPAAFDVAVTSVLSSAAINDASAAVWAATFAADEKHAANDDKFQELG